MSHRKVDRNVDTSQTDHTILSGFTKIREFDDHLDLDSEMTNGEAMRVMVRGLRLVRYAKALFFSKWAMSFAFAVTALYVPWFFKVITDHVILDYPFVIEEMNFPPHFIPVLYLLEGMSRMEMMFAMSCMFMVLLLVIGTRSESGTGTSMYEGRDNASRAENAISRGGSSAGGLFGILEFWIDVRLTQRVASYVQK